jgi:hypothetical protein
MSVLSQRDLYAFTSIVGGFLPASEGPDAAWTTPGEELGLASGLPDIFARLPHDQDRRELKLFLGMLNSAAGGMALYGRPIAFTRLRGEERAEAIRRMTSHPSGLMRKGAIALKTLAAFLWMATEDPDHRPPPWDAIG